MKEDVSKQLMRRLHGELDPVAVAEIERRIATDPEWAREAGRLEKAWVGIVDLPETQVPAGFSKQVVDAARRERATIVFPSWSQAPRPARWAAAAAAVTGIIVGSLLAPVRSPVAEPEIATPEQVVEARASLPRPAAEDVLWEPAFGTETLADSYWELLLLEEQEDPTGGAG